MGAMMSGYFGVTLVLLGARTLTGTWNEADDSLSLAFFWIAVPAYLTWGLGLVAAALAYHRVTGPHCRECGQ
jgi:hypothetical protein